jgi:heptose-I-phosphate ethanolaminephosphotransferase
VEQWVNKQQQGAVLFVHLMGSHWSYCARLPIDFIQEKQLKVDSERECYPGTILYKDHVLGEIIKLLNTTSKVAALLYFSDHGEEVDQGYGHQSDLFDMAMVEIPVVFWANEKFRARYESRVAAFHKNKDRYFSNDLVYEAILGMLGEKIDDSFNVFSPQYAGDQFERKTLDGRVTIPKASLRE